MTSTEKWHCFLLNNILYNNTECSQIPRNRRTVLKSFMSGSLLLINKTMKQTRKLYLIIAFRVSMFRTSVNRRKLKWHGHVTRSSGLAKTILQGTVQGGRHRGRQRKRWEDNIKEWTGFEWNILLRKSENRAEWRKLVVKSTVVPQRSARLDKIR